MKELVETVLLIQNSTEIAFIYNLNEDFFFPLFTRDTMSPTDTRCIWITG